MKNIKLILLVFIIAFSGCKPTKYANLGDGLFADIQTNKGDMVVKFYHEQTPVTVANFVSLAEGKNPFVSDSLKGKPFYDGLIFHRVVKDFIIQGGDPAGIGTGGPGYRFEDEFVDSLRHHKKGILSMANSGPAATNGSQFFITLKEIPHLDAYDEKGFLKPCGSRGVSCHTVFGEVVQGMEVLESIGNAETIKGGFRKNRPTEDIFMKHVEIVRKGKSARNFDAVEIMNDYFEAINKREAEVKKIKADLAAEFESQKAEAETLPSGLKVLYLNKSERKKPKTGQKVMVNYAGFLADGTLFDTTLLNIAEQQNKVNAARKQQNGYVPYPMLYSPEARLIPGFREGLLLMKVGDKVRLFIPSELGYGPTGSRGVIPPNADLVFDIEIVAIAEQ